MVTLMENMGVYLDLGLLGPVHKPPIVRRKSEPITPIPHIANSAFLPESQHPAILFRMPMVIITVSLMRDNRQYTDYQHTESLHSESST